MTDPYANQQQYPGGPYPQQPGPAAYGRPGYVTPAPGNGVAPDPGRSAPYPAPNYPPPYPPPAPPYAQQFPPAGPGTGVQAAGAGGSNRRRFLFGAGIGVPVLGALGFLLTRLGGGGSNQAAGNGSGVDPNNYDPSSLPSAAQNPNAISTDDVQALIATANKALKNRDDATFVAAYAPGAAAKQASRMFANIGKFDFDFLEYQLISKATRTFDSGSDSTLGVDVALVHQISGVDVTHVAEWYRWNLSRQGSGAPVVIESVTGSPSLSMGGAKYVYYPHPWDSTADITVIKQGNAILCAEDSSDAEIMRKHASEAVAAIQHNQDAWTSGGGKSGLTAGALMMAAHTRDSFYKWFSGAANTYGNEAGLTIGMITAEALASGGGVIAIGGSRITLDVTTQFFTVDQGGDSVVSILQHEDAHKLVDPLLTATDVPKWVVEGFADYMATRTLGGLKSYFRIPDVKSYAAGRTNSGKAWDGTLPTDDEVYDNSDATIESGSYGLSTIAYYYIESVKGLSGVVSFIQANYQAAAIDNGLQSGKDNLAAAFQSVLGMSQQTFVSGWLAFMKQQIGVSPR